MKEKIITIGYFCSVIAMFLASIVDNVNWFVVSIIVFIIFASQLLVII